jgi:hypothetical protein
MPSGGIRDEGLTSNTFTRSSSSSQDRSVPGPLLGPCFVAPKVLREEAASAEIVPRKWPKVPFYRASALQTDIKIE